MGDHSTEEKQTFVDDTLIEYFMLDVQIEQVDNPLEYLDTRFDEIQEKKRKAVVVTPPTVKVSNGNHSPWIPQSKNLPNKTSEGIKLGNDFDYDYSFREWMDMKKGPKAEAVKQPTLFSDEEMGEMVDTTQWEPDPTIIHRLVCQMVTCSLIVNDNVDLKHWINRWMDKKYKEIFGPDCNESLQFQDWKEFIIEFMLTQYTVSEDDIPVEVMDDLDLIQSKSASAMYAELYQYAPDGTNVYIDDYKEVLMRYIYE